MSCKECHLLLERHTLAQLESCASLQRMRIMMRNYSVGLEKRRAELTKELLDTTKQE